MELINFTNAIEIAPEYTGSEKKKTMILENKKYLVKFPDPNRSTKLQISYINNVYSEYIGTKIFELCGFKTQKVELGVYNIDIEQLKEEFWNMFIIDCLIGNEDRHNGNGGFLKTIKDEKLTFSPIYDCGSCLFSTYTDEDMKECLNNNTKMQDCIKNTSSAIRYNGSKIKYFELITSLKNENCNNALIRMYNKINLIQIFKLINDIEVISDIRKEFYCKVIEGKYKEILTIAYKRLNNNK